MQKNHTKSTDAVSKRTVPSFLPNNLCLKRQQQNILLHRPEGRCYGRIIFGFIYNKVTFETAPGCNLLPPCGFLSFKTDLIHNME